MPLVATVVGKTGRVALTIAVSDVIAPTTVTVSDAAVATATVGNASASIAGSQNLLNVASLESNLVGYCRIPSTYTNQNGVFRQLAAGNKGAFCTRLRDDDSIGYLISPHPNLGGILVEFTEPETLTSSLPSDATNDDLSALVATDFYWEWGDPSCEQDVHRPTIQRAVSSTQATLNEHPARDLTGGKLLWYDSGSSLIHTSTIASYTPSTQVAVFGEAFSGFASADHYKHIHGVITAQAGAGGGHLQGDTFTLDFSPSNSLSSWWYCTPINGAAAGYSVLIKVDGTSTVTLFESWPVSPGIGDYVVIQYFNADFYDPSGPHYLCKLGEWRHYDSHCVFDYVTNGFRLCWGHGWFYATDHTPHPNIGFVWLDDTSGACYPGGIYRAKDTDDNWLDEKWLRSGRAKPPSALVDYLGLTANLCVGGGGGFSGSAGMSAGNVLAFAQVDDPMTKCYLPEDWDSHLSDGHLDAFPHLTVQIGYSFAFFTETSGHTGPQPMRRPGDSYRNCFPLNAPWHLTINTAHPSGTSATLNVDPAGTNNKILYTAQRVPSTTGAEGNNIHVQYIDPGAPSQSLSVDIAVSAETGWHFNIHLATNGGGAITSTANDIISAVNAAHYGSDLQPVLVATLNDSAGTGLVTAMAVQDLSGGVDAFSQPNEVGWASAGSLLTPGFAGVPNHGYRSLLDLDLRVTSGANAGERRTITGNSENGASIYILSDFSHDFSPGDTLEVWGGKAQGGGADYIILKSDSIAAALSSAIRPLVGDYTSGWFFAHQQPFETDTLNGLRITSIDISDPTAVRVNLEDNLPTPITTDDEYLIVGTGYAPGWQRDGLGESDGFFQIGDLAGTSLPIYTPSWRGILASEGYQQGYTLYSHASVFGTDGMKYYCTVFDPTDLPAIIAGADPDSIVPVDSHPKPGYSTVRTEISNQPDAQYDSLVDSNGDLIVYLVQSDGPRAGDNYGFLVAKYNLGPAT